MPVVWRYAAAQILAQLPYSMLVPLVAVRMAETGVGAFAVGVYAMLAFLPILVLTPFVARIIARLGLPLAFRFGMVVHSAAAVGTAIADDYLTWCVAAALFGVAAAIMWSGTDALVARNALEGRIGRVTGLYQTLLGAAFAAGPFVAPVLGLSFGAAGYVAVGFVVLSWLPIVSLPIGRTGKGASEEPTGFFKALAVAPTLVVAGFLGGVYENGLNAVGPVQAIGFGYAAALAPMVAGVIAAGSLAVQLPLGRLADRVASRGLLISSMALLLAASSALPLAASYPALFWAVAAVWGAVGGGLYTLAMIRIGIEQRGAAFAATAAVISGYTAGGVVGPVVGGVALDLSPTYGLAASLDLLTLAGLAAVLRRPSDARRGLTKPSEQRTREGAIRER